MSPKLKIHGFTLLEVLVSMIVFAIGMLGLAGMQGIALKDNNDAYHRSQAVFFAQDLGDRIRANPAHWRTNITEDPVNGVTNLGTTQGMAESFSSTDFPYCSTDNPPTGNVGEDPAGCTDAVLAQYDWYQSRQSIINDLPNGGLELNIASEDGENVIEIIVSWNTTTTAVTDDSITPSFTYNVRP